MDTSCSRTPAPPCSRRPSTRRTRRRPDRPSITRRLLAAFADTHAGPPLAQPIEPLTSREEEILIPVAQGWTNHEIADDLHISLSTVETHLAGIMRKLDARNRVEIAMWTYEPGRIKN